MDKIRVPLSVRTDCIHDPPGGHTPGGDTSNGRQFCCWSAAAEFSERPFMVKGKKKTLSNSITGFEAETAATGAAEAAFPPFHKSNQQKAKENLR